MRRKCRCTSTQRREQRNQRASATNLHSAYCSWLLLHLLSSFEDRDAKTPDFHKKIIKKTLMKAEKLKAKTYWSASQRSDFLQHNVVLLPLWRLWVLLIPNCFLFFYYVHRICLEEKAIDWLFAYLRDRCKKPRRPDWRVADLPSSGCQQVGNSDQLVARLVPKAFLGSRHFPPTGHCASQVQLLFRFNTHLDWRAGI